MRKTRGRTAKFVQVLEYMDGPQAVLLERSADQKIVAVAIQKAGFAYPFFGAQISSDQWERYRRGFVDLRYLFMYPRGKEWYFFDLANQKDGILSLEPVKKDEYIEEHYIPEIGFFSYDHSEPIKEEKSKDLVTQCYKTDGIWDLPDFTHFYKKLTDLYAFFLSLKKYVDPSTPPDQKKQIRKSFMEQPLRGGSSYVNLFNGLLSVQQLGERISVGKLQYASKGEINVRGKQDIFGELAISIGEFTSKYDELNDKYDELYGYLAKNNLLRARRDRLERNDQISRHIYGISKKFAEMLRLEDANLIYELTGRTPLLYAKVLLSYYRRLERFFMFFAEGRIAERETIASE